MNSEDLNNAQILWDYHRLSHPLVKKDIMLVLGGHDLRVPEYAAELFVQKFAPTIIVSGGVAHAGDLLETEWNQTEAQKFAEVMMPRGVPRENILLENEAKNTGNNFTLSRKVLQEKDIVFDNALVVTKPYMERRAYATGRMLWPDIDLIVTSPNIQFHEYIKNSINPEAEINIMVGDLNRIIEYPKLGYQIEQDVPEAVLVAYETLKSAGYNKHLIHD